MGAPERAQVHEYQFQGSNSNHYIFRSRILSPFWTISDLAIIVQSQRTASTAAKYLT
jgi:hypothetical protein